ncbi:MAG: YggT family protein [Candidatus Dadabacteria bacterium]|nr:YggT family protein [Candidatus Dadabacteria bacterium]MCH7949946.1 YggT family protein [Candidatus Dadabacteria bacterium]TDI91109.1 MAG: YggT family protein [Candidatus Dadabacteria bacterium]
MDILTGNFLEGIAQVLNWGLTIYLYVIIARAIISWVSPSPYNPIVQFLYAATEPVLRYARRIIPPIGGTLDLSPLIVIVVIYFLRVFLVNSLLELAQRF